MNYETILQEAKDAGDRAALAVTPRPLVVASHANQLDDNSPVETIYVPSQLAARARELHPDAKVVVDDSMNEGICGFGWVSGISGNSAFGRWLKKNKFDAPRWVKEDDGGSWGKGYPSGYQFWVWGYGQSYERKRAFAYAYAQVLKDHGIQAYGQSRLD